MFKSTPKPERQKYTSAEKALRYRRLAESELVRSGRAGRLEAQAIHTTRAAALAALAVSYHLTPEEGSSEMPEGY